MHSLIFEISTRPLHKEERKNSFNFNESDNYIDYADDISDARRKTAIKTLQAVFNDNVPNMFTIEGEVITYHKEGMEIFKKNLNKRIQAIMDYKDMKGSFQDMMRELRNLVLDPIDTAYRFAIESDISSSSYWLLAQTDYMKDGDKLYIGGVIDYHI